MGAIEKFAECAERVDALGKRVDAQMIDYGAANLREDASERENWLKESVRLYQKLDTLTPGSREFLKCQEDFRAAMMNKVKAAKREEGRGDAAVRNMTYNELHAETQRSTSVERLSALFNELDRRKRTPLQKAWDEMWESSGKRFGRSDADCIADTVAHYRGDAGATPEELAAIERYLASGGKVNKVPTAAASLPNERDLFGRIENRLGRMQERRSNLRPDDEKDKVAAVLGHSGHSTKGLGAAMSRALDRHQKHLAKEKEALSQMGADKGPIRLV
jgi:hypothetical protein